MHRRRSITLRGVTGGWLVLVLSLSSSCRDNHATSASTVDASVLLLAAASTTDAVTALAEAYEDETGVRVRVSTGASTALAAQIIAGVPADLFLSANPSWAHAVEAARDVRASTPLLTNTLVLVVPALDALPIAGPDDLHGEDIRFVAVAGEDVPAGRYAEQALRVTGVYERLLEEGRLARGQDVRVTLGYVETGEADAGVVYATDARATDGVRIVHTFDASTHDRIIYPLLLLSGSAPAASFHDFLRTPDAMRVFQAHGFAPIAVTTGEAP